MDPLEHVRHTENLAHAYLVQGGSDMVDALKTFVQEKAGGPASPDLRCLSYDSFGVDEARELAQFASLKPIGEKKYLLIAFATSTSEAQNALLKIVEEGVGHSVFFFVVPRGAFILPTLTSRCVVLKSTDEGAENNAAAEFLSQGYADRLAYVEKLTKEEGGREEARLLVAALLAHVSGNERLKQHLRDLLEAEQFLKLSGSSVKSVVGHLALVL